ncbi:MAG: DUF4357 domain-containing protein [Anaerosomatales bacterium]|nr:DUF4357 domain-containing protein [Anaerosomatales bacterium]
MLEVVQTPSGIGYKLDGEVFGSPSGAAKHLTGGSINGWEFWKIS